MSELDLLNLARSTTEHQVTWFAQMVTINFRHGRRDLLLFASRETHAQDIHLLRLQRSDDGASGGMLVEANIKVGVIEALHALPAEHLSRPIVLFLSVYDSWLALITRITFNLSVWLFWFAMCYLLFFWKRDSNQLDSR